MSERTRIEGEGTAGDFCPGQELESFDLRLDSGTRLQNYEILAPLGEGGMGEVYRARDTQLGREVALKLLLQDLGDEPEHLARFEREARALAALNHPNVATLYGFFSATPVRRDLHEPLPQSQPDSPESSLPFLVMELVEGETLAARIERGALPLVEALPIFLQIAEGLDAAHEKGVIHRDLKPANIKIVDGNVKILDFGLAKAMIAEEELVSTDDAASQSPTLRLATTQRGEILGTAAYMSPEQARGTSVDRRTDVWAFGCCLYEALSGRRAFEGRAAADVLAKVIERDPDWTVLTGAPGALLRLLRRCLEKDRSGRLRDFGDIALELEDLDLGEGVEDSVPRPEALGSRRAWSLAGLVSGLIAGALLTVVLLPGGDAGSGSESRPTRVYTVSAAEAIGGLHSLALSPDGRSVVMSSQGTESPLLVKRLDREEIEPMGGTERGEFPFFSPDGSRVGYFTKGLNALQVTSLDGGPSVVLVEDLRRNWGGSWGDDGSIVFHGESLGNGLSVVSASGGATSVLSTPRSAKDEESHRWPQMLPGSEAVLFTIWGTSEDRTRIAVVRRSDGEIRELLPGTFGRYVASGHLLYFEDSQLMAVGFDAASLEVKGRPAVVPGFRSTAPWGHRQVAYSNDGLVVLGIASVRQPVWVDMEGNEAPLPLEPGDYMSPSLSSRGDRLAIAFAEEGGSHDIWTVDLAAGRGSRLTTDGENSSPLWVDDDRAIVFWSERNGVRTLYRRAADGSGEDEPVLAGPHGRPYSTTPDGRWITTNHRSDIWLVPTHPELEPRPLLETAFLEGNAAFSPDGEWYAYGSDEAGIGREDVYLRRADGSGGRITVTSEGGEDMVWSADGRTLYYRTADRVRAVDVELGPRPRVGSARTLFSDHYVRSTARNSDLSPDGRRFIMISEVESARLRFVENWFAELERLTSGD